MTTQAPKKRAQCSTCHADFEYDWRQLALHITSNKDKAHRKSRKWAANYLCRTRELNSKKDLPARPQLTEQDKENKRTMYREISGDTEPVKTVCPRCKRTGTSYLPVEYTQSGDAWRIDGVLVFLCSSCRGER